MIPTKRFKVGALVRVPIAVSANQQGRIVMAEYAGASRLAAADCWYYLVSFTPTGLAFRCSEGELFRWQGGTA